MASILSLLFPVKLGKVDNLIPLSILGLEPFQGVPSDGWCGKAQPKKYRNGIERFFAQEQNTQ